MKISFVLIQNNSAYNCIKSVIIFVISMYTSDLKFKFNPLGLQISLHRVVNLDVLADEKYTDLEILFK